jgi:2-polyprenyl-3-methyl-5-hydroxy-6-metoxy-1,4-benzoquinol methylase
MRKPFVITIMFHKLGIQSGDRILDIGCGSGRHMGAAIRLKNTFTVGIDVNTDCLMEAKNRLRSQENIGEGGGKWGLNVSDIECLSFRDSRFDLVVCSEVLEHLPDQNAAISEIRRVLKPGKILALSVPRYLPERICWMLSGEYHTAENGHIRIYKKRELIDLFQHFGFKLWHCHFAHSLHSPYWWLKCLVGPSKVGSKPVNLYHRFLTWDILKRPRVSRCTENLLNPILGKSIVLYFRKI